MEASFGLGKIKGIPIGIHYSWVIIFGIITWSLATVYFPSQYPDWPPVLKFGVGLITSLLFFGSVLFHELFHSFVALQYGIPVNSITLFIFGGVSQISREARTPASEFWIAISGPLSSIGLAIFFAIVYLASQDTLVPLAALARYLSYINLALAAFNLVPGFPLDGGRVLRSVVWGITGRFVSATRFASIVGQGIAYLIMLGGLIVIITGDVLGGAWFMIIGWFLANAAESSFRQVMLQDMLHDVPATVVMTRDFETVDPAMRLDKLVSEHILRHHMHAFPAAVDGGALQGIITLHDVKKVPQERWAFTMVSEVMTRAEHLIMLSPADGLAQAFQLLTVNRVGQIPVVERGQIIGLVTRTDLMHYIHTRSQLGV